MENKENIGSFAYTYSAQQQEEVKAIRQKYAPHEENKMEQLRRLDQSSSAATMLLTLIAGAVGAAAFGAAGTAILNKRDLA